MTLFGYQVTGRSGGDLLLEVGSSVTSSETKSEGVAEGAASLLFVLVTSRVEFAMNVSSLSCLADVLSPSSRAIAVSWM